MDRIIEDKRLIKPKHWKIIFGAAFVIVIVLYMALRDPVSTYRTEKEKLTIENVSQGEFKDYIRITGQVAPITTIYLDAMQGGRIEEILIEEGNMVKKGDVILKLSNNDLNLSILNSEAQLAEKSNFLREVRISMEQQKLDIERNLLQLDFDVATKKRNYEQNKALYKDELISREEYLLAKEAYELSDKSRKMMIERKNQDSIFRKIQVEQLEANLRNMERNLKLVNEQLENLNIKAPIDGQLGMLDAEIGESVNRGRRLGQVNVLTNFKIEAGIDEHYIDRVKTNLDAFFDRQTDTFQLKVKKVYPEVREGRFTVDLVFRGNLPDNIRIGQTYHISLELGQPLQAVLLPRGGFFQSTGGQYIYVVNDQEGIAIKRDIRLGRQNPVYYEVLEGLTPGEQVITSSYDAFGDNEKIVFK